MSVVELFNISASGMSHFLYTDCNVGLTFHSNWYTPYPISRGKISYSTDLKTDETNITLAKNWGTDMAIYKNVLAGATVQITRVSLADPDEDFVLLFDGDVSDTKVDEATINLRCTTLDFLNWEVPKREIQVACNWQLYGPYCGITQGPWTVTTTGGLDTTTPDKLAHSSFLTGATQHFRGGFVVGLSGNNNELIRHITNHQASQISVLPPFPFDFETDVNVRVVPGCDHSTDDCVNVFNNLDNYGGFPFIPNYDQVF
jgi:uncharacterized phage protein (TIGR02218 family)